MTSPSSHTDFDFFIGSWDVSHRRLKARLAGCADWDEFKGTTVVRKVLGGFGNIDDNVLELPGGYSSVALLLSAVEKGVSFLPGPLFDIDHRYVNSIRLSCAWGNDNLIKEGIELLADVISEFICQPPGDSGLSGMGGFQ